jgi:hypothetical protein
VEHAVQAEDPLAQQYVTERRPKAMTIAVDFMVSVTMLAAASSTALPLSVVCLLLLCCSPAAAAPSPPYSQLWLAYTPVSAAFRADLNLTSLACDLPGPLCAPSWRAGLLGLLGPLPAAAGGGRALSVALPAGAPTAPAWPPVRPLWRATP